MQTNPSMMSSGATLPTGMGVNAGMMNSNATQPKVEMVASVDILPRFEEDDDYAYSASMVDALFGPEDSMCAEVGGREEAVEGYMVDKRTRVESATDSEERTRRMSRRITAPTGPRGTIETSVTNPTRTEHATLMRANTKPGGKTEKRTKKTPMERMESWKSIRMMKGEEKWDYVKALRETPVTLNWGTLMELAPDITGGIAWSLVRERGNRKQKVNERRERTEEVQVVDVCNVERGDQGRDKRKGIEWVSGLADKLDGIKIIQEPTELVVNFYTEGDVYVTNWVNGIRHERLFRLSRILIDGGSVVNLIPLEAAKKMGLMLQPSNDLRIRTATNEIKQIDFSCQVILKISGVTCSIRAYCIPQRVNYNMLLGRRWLQQCKAKGDYLKHSYVIYDAKGEGHEVSNEKTKYSHNRPEMSEIILNPEKSCREEFNLADEEYTELKMGPVERTNAILARVMKQSAAESIDESN
ncbi:hypothetical protein DFH27DRAFT_524415 [Peziza echinospora]|nr:hypothetical protein DFH27DRAFT_524415 [Peziza echinospora]